MTYQWHSRRELLTLAGGTAAAALGGCIGSGDAEPDWTDVEEFYFEGRVGGWEGVEPALVEGEMNPTVVLYEGDEYDFGYVNADGGIHNIEIQNEDGRIVEDYETEGVYDEDAEEFLQGVVATPEMATYVCKYHQRTMVGDIEVRTG